MELEGKRVLVAGLGRSGVAAGRLLKGEGAWVTIQDIKEEARLGEEVLKLAAEGFELYLGRNPNDIVQNFDMLVLSPGISVYLPFVERAKSLNIPVIGEIELAFAFAPCPITAITGTNGKTTTTSIVGEIMRRKHPNTAVVGNIGVAFCEHVQRLTSKDWIVAEISSFQLEAVQEFRPHICAVLNISPDHLNRHKTMENYIGMKERIFRKQREEDFLVINYDDEVCRKMKARSAAKVIFFSRLQELEQGVFLNGSKICARIPGGAEKDIFDISNMKIIGGHNVENALAATAMCLAAGVSAKEIAAGLKAFGGVEHRLELVRRVAGVAYYNDSKATNVDSAKKSLEAINNPIVLIAGGSEKGSDFSEWVRLFPGRVKHLVVMGEVAERIYEVCKAHDYHALTKVNNLRDAVSVSAGKASAGDVVLLSPACASFDMFKDFEQRGQMFKQFVKAL